MSASREQIQELANAIALQAQSIADATIDEEAVYAVVKLLQGNVETLSAWTAHLSPGPVAQGKSHKPEMEIIDFGGAIAFTEKRRKD